MKLGRTFLKLLVVALGIFCAFLISACVGAFDDTIGQAEARGCAACNTGATYTLNEDGESYCLAGVGSNQTRLTVPSTYEGKPVTGIREWAFIHYASNGCSRRLEGINLKSLTLPDTITYIEDGAFSQSNDEGYAHTTIDKLYYRGTLEQWCNIKIGETPVSSSTKFYINGKLVAGELTIPESVTRIGGSAFENCSKITKVRFHDKLISIAAYAFGNCGGLTELDIPNSVTAIGNSAFYDCDGLTSVDVPDSVTTLGGAFGYCSNLEEVTLGAGVTYLSGGIFRNCTKLSKVNVKGMLTGIGERAFFNCTSITEFDLSDSEVTQIGYDAFKNCYDLTSFVIPASVTEIGKDAFSGCVKLLEIYNLSELEITCGSDANGGIAYYALIVHASLDEPTAIITVGDYIFFKGEENALLRYTGAGGSITLPDNLDGEDYVINEKAFIKNGSVTSVTMTDAVKGIGSMAFAECSALKSITLSNAITRITKEAFNECNALESVVLPTNLESVGESAFKGCTSLKSVVMPTKLENIGVQAFEKCTALVSVSLPSGLKEIGDSAFKGCNSLESVTFAEGLKTIGLRAFADCKALKSIVLPSTLESFGKESFVGCIALESANVGGLSEISEKAFYNCIKLSTVTFSSGLKLIGFSAFDNCSSLENLTLPEGLEVIGSYAFNDTGVKNLHIPASTTVIGYRSFDGSLENITVAAGNTVYRSTGNCLIEIETKKLIKGSKNSVIPADGSVTAIDEHAFSSSKITSIIIPEGVTRVGEYAFYKSSLVSVSLPSTLTETGLSMFSMCENLETVEIKEGVKDLNIHTFFGCSALKSINLPKSLTQISFGAFENCPNLKNVNYAGTREEWDNINKHSAWKSFGKNYKILVQTTDEKFEV